MFANSLIASASVLWFLGISALISLFSARFSPRVLLVINRVCGAVIVFYGLRLLWTFLKMVIPALPSLPYACGLGTVSLLTDDVAREPLVPVDGWLPVTRPDVDPGRLEALAAPPEVAARWEARLAAVGALVGEDRR